MSRKLDDWEYIQKLERENEHLRADVLYEQERNANNVKVYSEELENQAKYFAENRAHWKTTDIPALNMKIADLRETTAIERQEIERLRAENAALLNSLTLMTSLLEFEARIDVALAEAEDINKRDDYQKIERVHLRNLPGYIRAMVRALKGGEK